MSVSDMLAPSLQYWFYTHMHIKFMCMFIYIYICVCILLPYFLEFKNSTQKYFMHSNPTIDPLAWLPFSNENLAIFF